MLRVSRNLVALMGSSAMAFAYLGGAGAAVAQTVPDNAAPAGEAPAQEEAAQGDAPVDAAGTQADIVITGTRLGSNFTAPTPVTAITSERLESLSITNVGEALIQLPSFRSSSGPAQQANLGGSVGARLLDLRGLDPQRTLVLVDGRRFVPSTAQGSVDVNLIPSSIVRRSDIVTGGASAAYGSDAVAGVVNFILDRKKKGIEAEVVGGVSQRGDDGNLFVGLSGGTEIASGIHLVVAGEYEKLEGLGDCYSRDWCANQTLILGNSAPGAGGLPANLIIAGVNTSTMTPGGLINRSYNAAGQTIGTTATDPLRGTQFLANGTPAPFHYGSLVGPLFMLGGEGTGRNAFIAPFRLKVPLQRISTYAAFTAQVSDSVTVNADLSYGRVSGTVISNVMRDYNATLMGRIKRDNPFIPATVAAQMDANGVASFILGRAGFDLGPSYAETETTTYRGVLGIEAKLSSNWTLEGFYQYGKTSFHQRTYNAINLANLPRAIDAVRSGGSIVCRVNADASTANDDPNCVPFNPFGEGNYDPRAAAYVTGNGFQKTDNDQHVVSLDLRGTLFDLPAGPVTVAVGAEYRRDEITGTTDPVSLVNGFWTLNGSALAGHVEVKEGYGEIAVPVFKDSAIGHLLDLNGAIRRTDYSTSGAVTTWKIGAVYEPVEGIRLRGTRSRDIRAPNLSELVGPRTRRTIGLSDPANGGLQTNPTVITGSNPNLSVERADSWTVGAVFTPHGGFLGRFRASIDYYNIKVADAISVLGAQTLVNRCYEGVTAFCSQITRDPANGNTILQVDDFYLNANELRTSGFDIEFQYRQPLGSLGNINAQILANITNELATGGVDRAGQTGVRTGTIPGIPDYVIDGLVTWSIGNVQLTGHGKYIPSGIYWTDFIGPDQPGYSITSPKSVDNNRVPSRFYLDLTARVTVPVSDGRGFELFGTVNNVFDQAPPSIPGPSGGTNQILFDPVGRAFKVGARVKFGG
ncbi:TonB-dependent receptor [Sphingomonas sp. So64.6b]|uniref:TonB-dependent receptor domain-containing protein n=1 Tax=Sphingomonas sp. So64.6b TaxID=2997354 RepID=UPI0016039D3F|nr:TonB-dependent receptor [Sphingomonas sp. So64.6b]QNA86509.1 TonB-dependent receptor [Sphingomonas sp. So64.6b]